MEEFYRGPGQEPPYYRRADCISNNRVGWIDLFKDGNKRCVQKYRPSREVFSNSKLQSIIHSVLRIRQYQTHLSYFSGANGLSNDPQVRYGFLPERVFVG
jgi:hypothetical protein